MKKVKIAHIALSLVMGASAVAFASYPALKGIQNQRSEDQAEILHLNQALTQALVTRDFPKMQEMIADDFEIYLTNGEVLDKQTWIKAIQKRALNFENIEFFNPSFKGNELSEVVKVSGDFWGKDTSSTVQMKIRSISNAQNRQIKCIVVKKV